MGAMANDFYSVNQDMGDASGFGKEAHGIARYVIARISGAGADRLLVEDHQVCVISGRHQAAIDQAQISRGTVS